MPSICPTIMGKMALVVGKTTLIVGKSPPKGSNLPICMGILMLFESVSLCFAFSSI